ncbi:MAG: hypothetical protein ACI9T9_001503 [Oleiphilaceae bacterium]|jgi:hypothetical protein
MLIFIILLSKCRFRIAILHRQPKATHPANYFALRRDISTLPNKGFYDQHKHAQSKPS